MTTATANDYRLERAAQDARFDARDGAGSVDHTMTNTDEYRAYFGLGREHVGHGVEIRVTFKSFLIARAAERRAEREAEHAAQVAQLAEIPTYFLTGMTGEAVDAELERRAAEWDDEHAYEPAFDVEATVAEIIETAAVEIAETSQTETLARVATACNTVATRTATERRDHDNRRRLHSSRDRVHADRRRRDPARPLDVPRRDPGLRRDRRPDRVAVRLTRRDVLPARIPRQGRRSAAGHLVEVRTTAARLAHRCRGPRDRDRRRDRGRAMTAPTSLDDARAFGAAANAGERANLVEAQRRARHAVPVAPVQAELFGTAGELQPELFEIDR